MARDRANINTGIWNDADYRNLTVDAQHLYYMLMTHPTLTYVGVADWRPKRLTAYAAGLTVERIEQAAQELASGHYIVIDEDTEEVLVRSFVKHDGLLKQPRLSVSMANAYAQTASNTIRGVVVHELLRQRDENPEFKCWADPRVADVLTQPAVNPKTDPALGHGFGPSLAQTEVQFGPGLGMRTSTSTSTSSKEDRDAPPALPIEASDGKPPSTPSTRKKPSKPIPDDWTPSDSHRAKAAAEQIDLPHETEKFRNNALAKDQRFANWDRAFTNWLSQEWVRKLPGTGGFDPRKDPW